MQRLGASLTQDPPSTRIGLDLSEVAQAAACQGRKKKMFLLGMTAGACAGDAGDGQGDDGDDYEGEEKTKTRMQMKTKRMVLVLVLMLSLAYASCYCCTNDCLNQVLDRWEITASIGIRANSRSSHHFRTLATLETRIVPTAPTMFRASAPVISRVPLNIVIKSRSDLRGFSSVQQTSCLGAAFHSLFLTLPA